MRQRPWRVRNSGLVTCASSSQRKSPCRAGAYAISTPMTMATPIQKVFAGWRSGSGVAAATVRARVLVRLCALADLLDTGLDCVTSQKPLPVDAELPNLVGDDAITRPAP